MLKSEFILIIVWNEKENKINYKYLNFILFIRSCSLRINLTKSREELKWRPIYTLKMGLQEIITYHNKYIKNVSNKDLIYRDNQLK